MTAMRADAKAIRVITAAVLGVIALAIFSGTPVCGAEPFPLTANFNGIDDPTMLGTPDATIAAGPMSLVLARNSIVAIRDKAGTLLDSRTMANFFAAVRAPGANGLTDPFVVYDPEGARFFLANSDRINDPACTLGACVAHLLLAVSKTSSPATLGAADWYFYAFDRTVDRPPGATPVVTANWADFDRIAVSGSVVAITASVYRFSDRVFQGVNLRILDKTALISGQAPATWTDITGLPGSTQAAVTFPGSPMIFLVARNICQYRIFGISTQPLSPTITERTLTTTGFCRNAPDATQPGGAPPLDMVQVPSPPVHRNGRLWLSRVLGADFGSGEVSAVRWAEVDVSRWPEGVSVLQEGILGSDGVWNFAPAIMVDEQNNVMLVHGRSSLSEFPSLYYTGRLATDPLGTLRPSGLLKAGTATYRNIIDLGPTSGGARNRYTDYFGIAADPDTDGIWLLGLYVAVENRSGTWVGQVLLGPKLHLVASVNQSTFSAGQTIRTGVRMVNRGLPGTADIYAGTLGPDGSIEFITSTGTVLGNVADPSSFRPIATGVSLVTPFSVTRPDFSSHVWTGSELHGGYIFFLGTTKAGALADGMLTSDEILGLATAPYAFP